MIGALSLQNVAAPGLGKKSALPEDPLVRELMASRKSLKTLRQEAAQEKLANLKLKIQALHLMASGGNPQAFAREAARLEKEIAALRAAAGGGASLSAGADGSARLDTTGGGADMQAGQLLSQLKSAMRAAREKFDDDGDPDAKKAAKSLDRTLSQPLNVLA